MYLKTFTHGVLQALPFAGKLRQPPGDMDAGIVIARLNGGFLLPVTCAYQRWQDPMLVPIVESNEMNGRYPFGSNELVVPLSQEAINSILIHGQYLVANYLVSVGLVSYGGFEDPDEGERIFGTSLLYTDIKFWQGIEAAVEQLLYIILNQFPAEGLDNLDSRARQILSTMPFPQTPHTISAGYESMSFRLGRFASFHSTRMIILNLPDQAINVGLNWAVREQCKKLFPAYPGRSQMRNPNDAVPYIDMPE
ncbi:MAG: hypothetical protein RI947_611 [Candidatus Parcubacteria bacterium]|jgi:hypothetical protein